MSVGHYPCQKVSGNTSKLITQSSPYLFIPLFIGFFVRSDLLAFVIDNNVLMNLVEKILHKSTKKKKPANTMKYE